MCGIAGIFSIQQNHKVQNELLVESILDNQYRRGPDFKKLQTVCNDDKYCILGHNRLSIIDLSDLANQPMHDPSTGDWIVFNGEIYNYKELRVILETKGHHFITNSDTEVLLKWLGHFGIEGIHDCNGMFAFAWYKQSNSSLFLLRDRFGVKPLFYHINEHTIVFASSASKIASHFNLDPDMDYIARGLKYLEFENHTDSTQYINLKALPSGCFLEISSAQQNLKTEVKRYYNLGNRISPASYDMTFQDAVLKFTELFSSSMQLRMRSDVPIGVSLSGGLDSTSVAAYASEMSHEIKAYCFGNPKDAKSEGPLVEEFVKNFPIQVNYVTPNANEIETAFWNTIEAQDAPFGGPSIIAQNLVYQKAANDGIKVLLGGQGGDEGFAGYPKFRLFQLRNLLSSGNYAQAFIYFMSLFPLVYSERTNLARFYKNRKRHISEIGLSSQLILPQYTYTSMQFDRQESPIKNAQIKDVLSSSLPTLLRFEDRNSMWHSIESRLPYMDYRLIEFGISLSESYKLNKSYGKWINRVAFKNTLPHSISFAKRKMGFNVDHYMYKNGMGNLIRSTLKNNWTEISKLYKNKQLNIDEIYSDNNLENNFGGLGDIITSLWLLKKTNKQVI